MRQTGRRGSMSEATSVEKASGSLNRFKPNKDKG